MLPLFGVGLVVGILAVIGLLKLTMREEPTGCVIAFGTIFLVVLVAATIALW